MILLPISLDKNNINHKSNHMSDKVIIYTKSYCPYCVKAKNLLEQKGVQYKEVDVQSDDNALQEMLAKSNGRKTVPQIFIGDVHVGGCDDLYKLDSENKLDALLEVNK